MPTDADHSYDKPPRPLPVRVAGSLFATDHRTVGLQYIGASSTFLLFGFLLILLMRWQLAYPGQPVPVIGAWFGPDHPWMPDGALLPNFYNQLGAMHGTIMIFLAVVPLGVAGFGSYLVPLMIGAPNLAFPRWSRIGFWCYVAGAGVILASFFSAGGPPNSGWTSYPPLSVVENAGQVYWLVGMALVYLSSLLVSINILATVIQLRAPGMSPMRMPFFVWSQFVAAFLLLLAFPPLAAAAVMQWMDRVTGTSFFMPSGLVVSGQTLDISGGGSALLWQHLFWFLAHPEVYVLILPAFGIVSEVIANNTRRPLWGYPGMVASAIFMGFMSMLVWAHHMFLTGMGTSLNSFFQTTTIIISIPSVVLATSLVTTLWGGSIRFNVPMIFALAFLPMFGLGGLTGLPLAMTPTNEMLHDTYYVIGHFHYIVAPGTIFALFAGVYYWYPKVFGRKLNETLGHWHFWPSLIAMNGIFSHLLLQGLAGVSRRLYDGGQTYAHGAEVFTLNKAATFSAFLLFVAQLPFLFNLVYSAVWGEKTAKNPWNATTLEWHAGDVGRHTVQPVVARGPYEYSPPDAAEDDYAPQCSAGDAA